MSAPAGCRLTGRCCIGETRSVGSLLPRLWGLVTITIEDDNNWEVTFSAASRPLPQLQSLSDLLRVGADATMWVKVSNGDDDILKASTSSTARQVALPLLERGRRRRLGQGRTNLQPPLGLEQELPPAFTIHQPPSVLVHLPCMLFIKRNIKC